MKEKTMFYYELMKLKGYEFIADESMIDVIPNKSHKKKRISKKWNKKYGITAVPSQEKRIMGDKIFAHPKLIEELKQRIFV